jgi:hypothetical protein
MQPSAYSVRVTAPQWKQASPCCRAILRGPVTRVGSADSALLIPVPICLFGVDRQMMDARKAHK